MVAGQALLVIDMQRGFMEPSLPSIPYLVDSARVRAAVEKAVRVSRESGFWVVYTQHSLRADRSDVPSWLEDQIPLGWMIRGSESTEIWPTLKPEPGEPVVMKNRFDAFLNTELDQVLRLRGIEHLFVCGILTNYCVETTAKSAMQRDYRVTVLDDATDAMSADSHSRALDALRAYTIEVGPTGVLFDRGA
jgi:ureidoacrylate peracid hydrolase